MRNPSHERLSGRARAGRQAVMNAPRILVVEDNPVTRKMLRITLELEGWVVRESPDATSALAIASTEAIDLVIQDMVLPDADGLDLLRELRRLLGARRPIIGVTGLVARACE